MALRKVWTFTLTLVTEQCVIPLSPIKVPFCPQNPSNGKMQWRRK